MEFLKESLSYFLPDPDSPDMTCQNKKAIITVRKEITFYRYLNWAITCDCYPI